MESENTLVLRSQSYDLEKRVVILQSKDGSGDTRRLHYELLVGADGISSKARAPH